jgi:hypothetical protein
MLHARKHSVLLVESMVTILPGCSDGSCSETLFETNNQFFSKGLLKAPPTGCGELAWVNAEQ